ncbi:hypothetical protein H311_05189, partial [Anncaliia algerae PRA109]
LKEVLKKINLRINHLYNSSIKCSPNELINSFSIFDPLKRKLENIYSNKDTKAGNGVKTQIKVNDIVYTYKNVRKDKFDKIWEGPFIVKSIMPNLMTIVLKNQQGKEFKTTLRKVRKI